MPTVIPKISGTAYAQRGQSSQRSSLVSFNTNADFTQLAGLPVTVPNGTTLTTDPMRVIGFNTFMAFIITTGNTVSFRVTHIHPVTGAETTTRTIATSVVGTLTQLSWGWGNTIATGNSDVFNIVVYKFVATAGVDSVITVFPGIWGAAR